VIPLTEVLALLRSAEAQSTLEVQAKGCSYEITLPDNFESTWAAMESCRRNASTRALHNRSDGPAPRVGGEYEEVYIYICIYVCMYVCVCVCVCVYIYIYIYIYICVCVCVCV